jgi:hypothetical protein
MKKAPERIGMRASEVVQKNLWDVYQGLSCLEQSLIHLCAVIHEPATAPVVYSCFRKTRMAARYPRITSLKDINPILENLRKLNLLTDRLQCHSDFMEIAMFKADSRGTPVAAMTDCDNQHH